MTQDEFVKRLEARVAALEELAKHCSDPEDREIDNYLRKILKTMISFVWLVKNLTVIAGVFIAAKLAWDQMTGWFR